MTKRITPYERLRRECQTWAIEVAGPARRTMFVLSKDKLSGGYRLDDVRERVIAAASLGWRCELRAHESGDLAIEYVKEPSDAPWAIRP